MDPARLALNPMLTTPALVGLVTLGVMMVATAYTELRDGRIPNWITMPGLVIGLVTGYLPGGITLGQSLTGLLAGGGFLFFFYMFGGMGGGDVKLMAAVGAVVGYPTIVSVLMFTALLGGGMAVSILIWNRTLLFGLLRVFGRLRPGAESVEPDPVPDQESARLPSVPYGLAIVGGCLVVLVLNT